MKGSAQGATPGPTESVPAALTEGLLAWVGAPMMLGGLVIRAWAGPRRQRLLEILRTAVCGARSPDDAHARNARPWLSLPHHAAADQLEGGIDVGLSLSHGRPTRRAGFLDRALAPVVVVPMAERLSVGLGAALASALDAGRLALILLDESLEDESRPWPGLLDRLALTLDLRDEVLLAEVLIQFEAFSQSCVLERGGAAWPECLPAHQEAIASASLLLDVASARPLLHASSLARALARQRSAETVAEDDVALAIRLALVPHARRAPRFEDAPADDESAETPPESDPDDPAPATPPERAADQAPDSQSDDPAEKDPPDQSEDEQPEQAMPDGAAERMVEAALATLPPDVLAELAGRGARSSGRAVSAGAGLLTSRGRGRGRSVGARRRVPQGAERLHLFATLRAAIPWQRLRQASLQQILVEASVADQPRPPGESKASGRPRPPGDALVTGRPRLQLRKDDLHVHRELHRRGTTTVFVVDASGSTALQRLNEAKGAIELLLADCYVRRDRVALICFRGRGAELLLPPTRSLVAARRALIALPGGGGSPVSAGLELAIRVVSGLKRGGDDTQLVLLTDGRANLTRDGRPGRTEAAREAQTLARQLAGLATHRVLIDTSLRPEAAAEQLARALDARYCLMPFARAQAIRAAID